MSEVYLKKIKHTKESDYDSFRYFTDEDAAEQNLWCGNPLQPSINSLSSRNQQLVDEVYGSVDKFLISADGLPDDLSDEECGKRINFSLETQFKKSSGEPLTNSEKNAILRAVFDYKYAISSGRDDKDSYTYAAGAFTDIMNILYDTTYTFRVAKNDKTGECLALIYSPTPSFEPDGQGIASIMLDTGTEVFAADSLEALNHDMAGRFYFTAKYDDNDAIKKEAAALALFTDDPEIIIVDEE